MSGECDVRSRLLKMSRHVACRFGPGNSEGHAGYWTGASSIDKVRAASRQGNTAPAKDSCTGEASCPTKSEVAYAVVGGTWSGSLSPLQLDIRVCDLLWKQQCVSSSKVLVMR